MWFGLLFLINTGAVAGVCKSGSPSSTIFNIHSIFNKQETQAFGLYKFINSIHINTKEKTLRDRIDFFLQKESVDKQNLAELERFLRDTKYLTDAKVVFDGQCRVVIDTWDNWSLKPRLDIGRKAGVNKFSIGIDDDNLLGYGYSVSASHFKNANRSGYQLKTKIPVYPKKNLLLDLVLSNNDDGKVRHIGIKKPFVSVETKYAYNLLTSQENKTVSFVKNPTQSQKYDEAEQSFLAEFSWLTQQTSNTTKRALVGLSRDKTNFSKLSPIVGLSADKEPKNINKTTFWYAMQYQENSYQKYQNFNLINHTEDINLGFGTSIRIGLVEDKLQDELAIINIGLSRGYEISNSLILLNLGINKSYHKTEKSPHSLSINSDIFYKLNPKFSLYFKNQLTLSSAKFFNIGDENGVRGFGVSSQFGNQKTATTAELRHYPNIKIFKLYELGGAIFLDSSKVHGDDNTRLSVIGLGARFYTSKSSLAKVVHLDFIQPLTKTSDFDSIDFRLVVKQSF